MKSHYGNDGQAHHQREYRVIQRWAGSSYATGRVDWSAQRVYSWVPVAKLVYVN